MLGAIVGDVVGSVYEGDQAATLDFPLFHPYAHFTDDTVLTVAVAEAILTGRPYAETLQAYYRAYPHAGYGRAFKAWGRSDPPQPYGSFGNGSAMRVSPVAWAYDDVATVLTEAARSAAPTHNHPEGIKGAQAVALAILMARQGAAQAAIRAEVVARFGYDLSLTVADYHAGARSNVSCQGSVPQALVAFLEADSFEAAIRSAIYIGGDSDTLACMAGGMAAASFGGVPAGIAAAARARLPHALLEVIDAFGARFSGAA
jgi:ADP-ribosylglycohydrolase